MPTASDDVHFTSNSPNCTVNASNRSALSLDFTGYAHTLTMNQNITVSGNITLAYGMTVAGGGTLAATSTGTLTSNGKTWPNGLTLQGTSMTYTLADEWTIAGTLTLSPATSLTVNGHTFVLQSGFTYSPSGVSTTGTTLLKFTGTGMLSMPSITTGDLQLPMEFNTSGTITVSGKFVMDVNAVKYVAGTILTGAGRWGTGVAGTTQTACAGGAN